MLNGIITAKFIASRPTVSKYCFDFSYSEPPINVIGWSLSVVNFELTPPLEIIDSPQKYTVKTKQK